MNAKKRVVVIVVVFVALLVGASLLYVKSASQRVRVAGLETWVSAEMPQLVGFRPSPDTPALIMTRQGNTWTSGEAAFVGGTRGLIRLADGNWVFFFGYSSHGSGNLILAIDSEGHLWACNGHICPSFVLSWDDRPCPASLSLDDFRASRVGLVPGEKGPKRWRPVDGWKRNPPAPRR